MAERLRLELATPTRLLVSAEVDEVVVPGAEGAFGVLPGHAPLLALVGVGEVTYRTGREEHHLAVSGGFAEVGPDRVTILTEAAERPEDIDVGRARRPRAGGGSASGAGRPGGGRGPGPLRVRPGPVATPGGRSSARRGLTA